MACSKIGISSCCNIFDACGSWKLTLFLDVYKADNKIATSGATYLDDIDLRRTYRAIDSVATGRIPSLPCDVTIKISYTNDKCDDVETV